jgi:hypothetical protein
MKFVHLANWNSTNIGNGALAYGTEHILKGDFGPDTEFIRVPWDDYTLGLKRFDEEFVALVNREGGTLLINGAVTFNAFRGGMRNTGMRFDLPLPLWDRIDGPIIFYGVSYMCWPRQPYPNRAALKKTLEYIVTNKKVLLCVRNDGTKQWLEKLTGVRSDRIHEVPDPGMFTTTEKDGVYPEIDPARKNIIIAFNDENNLYRFGGKLREWIWIVLEPFLGNATLERYYRLVPFPRWKRRSTMKKLARAMHRISQMHPEVQFILAPHYLDDYAMIADYISLLKGRITHQMTISTGLLKVPTTEYFYGRYSQASLVLSMRIHSMSPSIGLGIPVIPMTYPGRMVRFLADIGLSDTAIDLFSNYEDVLVAKADALLKDPEPLKARLIEATATKREEFQQFNKNVLAPFLAAQSRS